MKHLLPALLVSIASHSALAQYATPVAAQRRLDLPSKVELAMDGEDESTGTSVRFLVSGDLTYDASTGLGYDLTIIPYAILERVDDGSAVGHAGGGFLPVRLYEGQGGGADLNGFAIHVLRGQFDLDLGKFGPGKKTSFLYAMGGSLLGYARVTDPTVFGARISGFSAANNVQIRAGLSQRLGEGKRLRLVVLGGTYSTANKNELGGSIRTLEGAEKSLGQHSYSEIFTELGFDWRTGRDFAGSVFVRASRLQSQGRYRPEGGWYDTPYELKNDDSRGVLRLGFRVFATPALPFQQ